MKGDVATYSYKALDDCANAVKAMRWSVDKRAEHFSKCFEVQKLFEFCFEKTDCLLFDPDFSPWHDYIKSVKQKASKKELDKNLRDCYRFVCNELNGILTMMRSGEVHSVE